MTYTFTAEKDRHEEVILCDVDHLYYEGTGRSSIIVNFAPVFVNPQESNPITYNVPFGETFELDCETEEHPAGSIQWHFTGTSGARALIKSTDKSIGYEMQNSRVGLYECSITNTQGTAKQGFKILLEAEENEMDVYADIGRGADLECKREATSNLKWTFVSQNFLLC